VLGVERAALAVVREATVEIVVPVYNEERDLERSVRRLRAYLDARFPFHATVTIADNASIDGTRDIGERLALTVPGVRYVRLADKGRGRALAAVWLLSEAEIVAYMDVDLATDLDALLPLVAPLISGHSEVAIGSRLASGSRVRRGLKRELISRCYNALLQIALGTRFKDAQCGFKAIRAETARRLVPRVENRSWFFDTELLVLAQRSGLRIHEVPVDWDDDPDSRVSILPTALEDLAGVWRLMRSGLCLLQRTTPANACTCAKCGRRLATSGCTCHRLEVMPANRPQVVEDSDPERDDRRDREVHAELVAEVRQPAREQCVGDQPAEEHARLERARDVRLERAEYRVERGQQGDRRVARVGDRDRDRRKKPEDDAEDREQDRDDNYLHRFTGGGVGVAPGDGVGGAGWRDR
jgi:Glycosyl transferase family 2